MKRPPTAISPEALSCLTAYSWPGNIRELENAIEHAINLGAAGLIRPKTCRNPCWKRFRNRMRRVALGKYQDAVHDTKRQATLAAVHRRGQRLTEAAKLLGVHPNYLHRLIRNLNLRPELKKFA